MIAGTGRDSQTDHNGKALDGVMESSGIFPAASHWTCPLMHGRLLSFNSHTDEPLSSDDT